jgi:hypothetical protein
MAAGHESVLPHHDHLKALDLGYVELDDLSAPQADKVIVMPARGPLILAPALAEIALGHDARFRKRLQGAVHRRKAYPGFPLAHEGMQLLGTQVAAHRQQGVRDDPPGAGGRNAFLMKNGIHTLACHVVPPFSQPHRAACSRVPLLRMRMILILIVRIKERDFSVKH